MSGRRPVGLRNQIHTVQAPCSVSPRMHSSPNRVRISSRSTTFSPPVGLVFGPYTIKKSGNLDEPSGLGLEQRDVVRIGDGLHIQEAEGLRGDPGGSDLGIAGDLVEQTAKDHGVREADRVVNGVVGGGE